MRLFPLLTCREVSEDATGYMEGGLSVQRRLAVQLHLSLCRMCRNYLEQLRRTAALLRGRPLPPPAADIEQKIIERARNRG